MIELAPSGTGLALAQTGLLFLIFLRIGTVKEKARNNEKGIERLESRLADLKRRYIQS